MQLIPTTTTVPDPAEVIAARMIAGLNDELNRRVATHRNQFLAFWASAPTPDDILAALGPAGPLVLAAAGENVEHIGRLAAIVGKTVEDFLPASHWQPKREFVQAADGAITLAPPAAGYDAWGNPIAEAITEPEA